MCSISVSRVAGRDVLCAGEGGLRGRGERGKPAPQVALSHSLPVWPGRPGLPDLLPGPGPRPLLQPLQVQVQVGPGSQPGQPGRVAGPRWLPLALPGEKEISIANFEQISIPVISMKDEECFHLRPNNVFLVPSSLMCFVGISTFPVLAFHTIIYTIVSSRVFCCDWKSHVSHLINRVIFLCD